MKAATLTVRFVLRVDKITRISYYLNEGRRVDMREIAQRLKGLRESVNLSQAKLAALMGATQASVNRYENGQSSPPLKILQWYADFFDVSMDYIFARTDQPEGKLYEHKPKVLEAVTQENKELREFVDMCFDPASPISQKLREVLTKSLEEQRK